MSSFGHYARKARDPNQDIWTRWSALHSCVLRYCELTHRSFGGTRERLLLPLQVGEGKPPTDEQIAAVLAILEVERNRFLERQRAFYRKGVREKAQGKRSSSRGEIEALYKPAGGEEASRGPADSGMTRAGCGIS